MIAPAICAALLLIVATPSWSTEPVNEEARAGTESAPPPGDVRATEDDESRAFFSESESPPPPVPSPTESAPAPRRPIVVEEPPRRRTYDAPTRTTTRDVEVRPGAPLRYVVKKGDTLWDIAGYYLKDPWLWPELWYTNPAIKNPHLIYPGDVLHLVWVEGRQRVTVDEKLSPRIRELPLEGAIPTIPIDAIRAFLRGPRVVGAEELDKAPYIVEFAGEHLVGGAGMDAYVRRMAKEPEEANFSVVRKGQVYRDPDDKDRIVGYEAIYVGSSTITRTGDPATVHLDTTVREVIKGDRLLPAEDVDFTANFYPRAPDKEVVGRIIAVYDGVMQIGQYQIVTLNRGARHGLETGHVLGIWQAGRPVRDKVTGKGVVLPEERAGTLLVFKTYDRISYGLVMKATRTLHVLDRVRNPDADLSDD